MRDLASDDIEYIVLPGVDESGLPLSSAVRVGRQLYVSGTPGFDSERRVASGFAGQMTRVMESISRTLGLCGTGWSRVVKVNVILTRQQDFAEMNRLYAAYFERGKYPARTTTVVSALPRDEFLLEIECIAALI